MPNCHAIYALILTGFAAAGCAAPASPVATAEGRQERVTVARDDGSRRVDVSVDGKPFTSYIYPSSLLTDAQAADYTAAGFELAAHVFTGCVNWSTSTSLSNSFASAVISNDSNPAPCSASISSQSFGCVA